MLTDEQLIQRIRAALENESAGITPRPDLLASIHEELRDSPAAGRRRWPGPVRGLRIRPAHLAPVIALLVAVAVVAVFLGAQSRKPIRPGAAQPAFEVVYRAEPTPQVPVVNRAAMARAVSLLRHRIAVVLGAGQRSATVTSSGTEIFVHVAGQGRISPQLLLPLIGTSARLAFYDWEANVLAPSGKPVARLLTTHDQNALLISQGGGTSAPGALGAGSLSLYRAVKLAAQQPQEPSPQNSRIGPEYFAFGAPGSPACAAAASHYHVTPVAGQHCPLTPAPQASLGEVQSVLPPGVSLSETGVQTLRVQQGWVVLQAVPSGDFTHELSWASPSAQYYVLRDRVALFGNDITNPRQSTDSSGSPDVKFGFTSRGARAFSTVTANIAHRGDLVSGLGQSLNQHFAVALDTQLITVPSIDFKTYPDGVPGSQGGVITGPLTTSSARALATQLRLGWLPVSLKLLAVRSG